MADPVLSDKSSATEQADKIRSLEKSDDKEARLGMAVQLQRKLAHVTQKKLADQVGISFQQLQKYESGEIRIPATKLQQISEVLDLPISIFFETAFGETERTLSLSGRIDRYVNGDQPELSVELLRLFDAYLRVRNAATRAQILSLVDHLAAVGSDES
jgi:transcriptional regulator with XRE-family HTH domain